MNKNLETRSKITHNERYNEWKILVHSIDLSIDLTIFAKRYIVDA